MIEEGMNDKEKEIIRATWPGIYMRPKREDLIRLTRDKEKLESWRNEGEGA